MPRQSKGLNARDSNVLTVRVATKKIVEFRKICNNTGVQPADLIRNLLGEYIENNSEEDNIIAA